MRPGEDHYGHDRVSMDKQVRMNFESALNSAENYLRSTEANARELSRRIKYVRRRVKGNFLLLVWDEINSHMYISVRNQCARITNIDTES